MHSWVKKTPTEVIQCSRIFQFNFIIILVQQTNKNKEKYNDVKAEISTGKVVEKVELLSLPGRFLNSTLELPEASKNTTARDLRKCYHLQIFQNYQRLLDSIWK